MRASLLGIAVRPVGQRLVRELQSARLTPESGLEGDKRSRPGRRQLTLLTLRDWQAACSELGVELPWTLRRANLLVDELPLYLSSGARISCGEVVLEVSGETDPCAKMEAVHPGLFQALKPLWRGGVTCRVLHGGTLNLGDELLMELP